jgi:Tfp pilus assembly protein PilF
MYESKGEKESAAKEYRTALELDPKAKSARECLKRLGKD